MTDRQPTALPFGPISRAPGKRTSAREGKMSSPVQLGQRAMRFTQMDAYSDRVRDDRADPIEWLRSKQVRSGGGSSPHYRRRSVLTGSNEGISVFKGVGIALLITAMVYTILVGALAL